MHACSAFINSCLILKLKSCVKTKKILILLDIRELLPSNFLLLYSLPKYFCLFLYPATSKSVGYYVIPSAKDLRSSVRPSVRLSVRPSALRFRALT